MLPLLLAWKNLNTGNTSSATPLGSTGIFIWAGITGITSHCQICGHTSTRHHQPPVSATLALSQLHTAIPGAGIVETPAQRSSGMLLSIPWSRRWLRITPGCDTGVPSAPKQQHHHTWGVTGSERWEKNSAHCSEKDRDFRISNNYIKQLKENNNKKKQPGKLNAGVPTAAPLGLCGDGSGWDPQTLLQWLWGTPEQCQPCLPLAGPPLPD